MRNETIALFLENYNKWRRGDESVPMPKPHEIGEVIDCAVANLRHDDMIITAQEIRLKNLLAGAKAMLRDMIDGGVECRSRDSQLSEVIRYLEGKT